MAKRKCPYCKQVTTESFVGDMCLGCYMDLSRAPKQGLSKLAEKYAKEVEDTKNTIIELKSMASTQPKQTRKELAEKQVEVARRGRFVMRIYYGDSFYEKEWINTGDPKFLSLGIIENATRMGSRGMESTLVGFNTDPQLLAEMWIGTMVKHGVSSNPRRKAKRTRRNPGIAISFDTDILRALYAGTAAKSKSAMKKVYNKLIRTYMDSGISHATAKTKAEKYIIKTIRALRKV